jgi:hypothetical protein
MRDAEDERKDAEDEKRRAITISALKIGAVIAVVRLTAYGVGAFMMRQADIRQVIGYFLLLVSALPELAILAPVRQGPFEAYVAMTVMLIAMTSFGIGWLAAYLRTRGDSGPRR